MNLRKLIVATACVMTFSGAAYADPDDCMFSIETCEWCKLGEYGVHRASVFFADIQQCVPCMRFCPWGRFASKADNEIATDIQNETIAAIETRLFIKISKEQVKSMARVNPNAALTLYSLALLSENPRIPLPARSEVSIGVDHSYETAVQVIDGVPPAQKGGGEHKGIDRVGAVSYALKNRGDEAFLDVGIRDLDGKSALIKKPDLRVFVNWVPVENGGYWEYSHFRTLQEVEK